MSIGSLFYQKKRMKTETNNELPHLSIVVCTYNRAKYILRNLKSFTTQTLPFNEFEIVLVNNNSPDNTDELCVDFISKHPNLNITYVIETNQGHTFARNRGIHESKADLIAFIDDDAFVRPEYCKNIIEFFASYSKVDVIGGKIIPIYESGKEPDWMSPYLLTLMAAQDMGEKIIKFPSGKFPIGANMIYRKKVFKKIGVFNTELGRRGSGLEGGDEKDLIHRLRQFGGSIYYVPNVIVDHIIGEHREKMQYIKAMGIGVGTSERTRIKKEGIAMATKKIIEELFKWGATGILFFYYSIQGQFVKGWTLAKFRFWVLRGLIIGNKQ